MRAFYEIIITPSWYLLITVIPACIAIFEFWENNFYAGEEGGVFMTPFPSWVWAILAIISYTVTISISATKYAKKQIKEGVEKGIEKETKRLEEKYSGREDYSKQFKYFLTLSEKFQSTLSAIGWDEKLGDEPEGFRRWEFRVNVAEESFWDMIRQLEKIKYYVDCRTELEGKVNSLRNIFMVYKENFQLYVKNTPNLSLELLSNLDENGSSSDKLFWRDADKSSAQTRKIIEDMAQLLIPYIRRQT